MEDKVKIGIIGDFDPSKLSHSATNEALRHCAAYLSMDIKIQWLPTKDLEGDMDAEVPSFDAFWCSPGSPYTSYTGAINAIRFVRENDYPFLGTCGGFQHAVMEYARNISGFTEVTHAEYNPDASSFFIAPLSCSLAGETKKINLKEDSLVQKIYGIKETLERYNCSFGLNPSYQDALDQSGFHVTGTDDNGEVRILELPGNRFYIATLFQPQLSSTPENPHKLILAYLAAAQKYHRDR